MLHMQHSTIRKIKLFTLYLHVTRVRNEGVRGRKLGHSCEVCKTKRVQCMVRCISFQMLFTSRMPLYLDSLVYKLTKYITPKTRGENAAL
jgi:hypothetical protein